MRVFRSSRRRFLAGSLGAVVAYWGKPWRPGSACATGLPAQEVPWLEEVQRIPQVLPPDAPRLSPVLVDRQNRPIRDLQGWQHQRAVLRQAWSQVLGSLEVKRSGVPRLEVLEEERADGAIRQRVRYDAEPGEPTEAYLLRPAAGPGERKRPGVVVFHPTVTASIREPAGVEGRPNMAMGLNLARRGWVALCPRNFLWPDNRKLNIAAQLARFRQRHPKATGMAKMLFDAITAVDILASLPEVDARRLGAAGHSLGAKEVLYLAAFDERIRVAVSSEGGIGIRFSNWHDPWYLGSQIQQADFVREHHELLALVAPRAFLLLGGDSADGQRSWPFIQAALPVYRLYGQPARVGLFNHRKGHSLPPEAEERLYAWFEAYG